MRRNMEMVAGRYLLAFDHRQTFERLVHEGGRESRGLLISRSIERLREAGVEPTTWKVEPLDSRTGAC